MKFHVLCFSLLYNLLNLFLNKEISSIQEKIKAYIKTDLCEKLGSLADQVDVHIFHFLEKAEICIIWKLLTVLDENCSSTMFLCYLFQCKTAVDEYADILFELIANELVIYQSVLQNIGTYKNYVYYMILELGYCWKEIAYLTRICYISLVVVDILCYQYLHAL